MKPTIFIGSSKESLSVAKAVQVVLSTDADVTLWNQGIFLLSKTAIHDLLEATHRHDYAIFILANDDLALVRGQIQNIPRDNVLFELGMFIATVGLERTFLLVSSENPNLHIPTDLIGITVAIYNPHSHNGNLKAAVSVACTEIMDAIGSHHPLSGEWLVFIEGSVINTPNGIMNFVAAGDIVTARLHLFQDTNGQDTTRDFLYEGRYVAGQVVLTFEQGGAQDQIVGVMVLRFRADRSALEGRTTFWHHDKAKMVTTDFILKKPENNEKVKSVF
ncbi:MAG TPA: nucleotide-binding protein [Paludibacter sp.]